MIPRTRRETSGGTATQEDAIDLQDALRSTAALADRRAVALQQLRQMASAMSRTIEEDPILDEVCRSVQRAVGFAGVVVALIDEQTSRLAVPVVPGKPGRLRHLQPGFRLVRA